MREKDYNTGLRGVLFEARHYQRMGSALWLYGWLVLRQTHQHDGLGWVLGGAAISYREIEEETGFNRRTLERWMRTLRQQRYIETDSAPGGVIVRITKAKKFRRFPHNPQPGRKSAHPLRGIADPPPQNCVAVAPNPEHTQQVAQPIRSSSVEKYIENSTSHEIHNNFHNQKKSPASFPDKNPQNIPQNSSGLGQNLRTQRQYPKANPPSPRESSEPASAHETNYPYHIGQFWRELRRQQKLLRIQREEEIRRELHVGSGPEVHRS